MGKRCKCDTAELTEYAKKSLLPFRKPDADTRWFHTNEEMVKYFEERRREKKHHAGI